MREPAHDGLTFRTFRAGDESERMAGWYEAQSRGFHQGRTSDALRGHLEDHLVTDGATVRGVWLDRPVLGAGDIPVATYLSYDKTLNTGRGLQPARMISMVTVSPTHRRRGLLRRLITEDLADAVAQRVPLAVLTVSEGSIYGRFGFGPAVFKHSVGVDTGPRFSLRAHHDTGSVELLEPAEAWPAVAEVFERFHERTRGSVERPQFYETFLSGEFDFDSGPDLKLRTAVHLDADGAPDGYVAYRPGPSEDGMRTIRVTDLVTLSPAAYLSLWRFLADLDLSDLVEWDRAPVDDPLPWALADPFVVRVVRQRDALWVRVLDVPAALSARPWGRDGQVVLQVDDPLGHAAGRFRVVTGDGFAEVEPTEADADVVLDADVLGSLHLGGVRVEPLQRAGRISGSDDGLRTWAAMADTGPVPYCATGF
ncbi:MAG TPA: GNAT family N-acetyltransferase [Nocardioides sp.]|uniref:GNAT family N-acetyltransferase n=1 Tax=Nocardioides sp. TaxID=35761 RepID=UPI002E36C1AB|nr:GNAT family N-acetyltransferase [Nocardioides sp.]HEX5088848.1 GNAT family N-acetyltransferase [Nocardioides sp.]